MKRLFSILLLLVLSVLFVFTSCGDPFSGSYREATGHELLNAKEAIKKLNLADPSKKSNVEINGTSKRTMTSGEDKYDFVVTNYELYDYSDSTNILIHSSLDYNVKKNGSFYYETTFELWFKPSEDLLYFSYIAKGNSQIGQINGFTKELSNDLFDQILQLGKELSPDRLAALVDSDEAVLYLVPNEDRYRIDENVEGYSKTETYISITDSNNYKAKQVSTYYESNGDISIESERLDTNEKVAMPNLEQFKTEYTSEDVIAMLQNTYRAD